MKAVVFHKPKDVSVDTVDDPVLKNAGDAIIKVTSTAICGSDLHILNGCFPQVKDMIMGHECMGIVEEVGKDVKNIAKGDRVVVPFPVSCGYCWFCTHDALPACENSNPDNYGPEGGIVKEKGGGILGYTDLYGGYEGGQAEYLRVPYADFGPRKISDEFSDEQVLFLTDIFPTGYSAIDWADLKGGETVAVFGCGPVGLMAQKVAWLKGAGRVIGIDPNQYRLDAAKKTANSETILLNDIEDKEVIEKIRSMTNGRGADVVVDAVGMEAKSNLLQKAGNILHHAQIGNINALGIAMSAVRRGGFVSVVGVYGTTYDNFPFGQYFDKGLTMRAGQAPVQKYIDELIRLVEDRKIILDDIISHTLPLSDAQHAYDIFLKKEDNCVKVVLKP